MWVVKGFFTGLLFFIIFAVIYLRGYLRGLPPSRPNSAISIGIPAYAITRPLCLIVLILMVVTASLCFKLLQK
jgi:hypothetical protein